MTDSHNQPALDPEESLIQWLLDSDPAIRWQTMQALLHAPAEEVAAERARVATEGWGAKLLAMQGADGTWGGEAWNHGAGSDQSEGQVDPHANGQGEGDGRGMGPVAGQPSGGTRCAHCGC